jgi:hypothetical protein
MWSAGGTVEIGRKPGGRHRLRLGGPDYGMPPCRAEILSSGQPWDLDHGHPGPGYPTSPSRL